MADMIVAGAGTSEVNGTYAESGTEKNRPKYVYDSYRIAYSGFRWQILLDTTIYYRATPNNEATPDLATGWAPRSPGVAPAPTVTAASSGQNLTLTCAAGSYSLTGSSVTLTHTPSSQNLTLTANAGSYSLSGTAANFEVTRNFTLRKVGMTGGMRTMRGGMRG